MGKVEVYLKEIHKKLKPKYGQDLVKEIDGDTTIHRTLVYSFTKEDKKETFGPYFLEFVRTAKKQTLRLSKKVIYNSDTLEVIFTPHYKSFELSQLQYTSYRAQDPYVLTFKVRQIQPKFRIKFFDCQIARSFHRFLKELIIKQRHQNIFDLPSQKILSEIGPERGQDFFPSHNQRNGYTILHKKGLYYCIHNGCGQGVLYLNFQQERILIGTIPCYPLPNRRQPPKFDLKTYNLAYDKQKLTIKVYTSQHKPTQIETFKFKEKKQFQKWSILISIILKIQEKGEKIFDPVLFIQKFQQGELNQLKELSQLDGVTKKELKNKGQSQDIFQLRNRFQIMSFQDRLDDEAEHQMNQRMEDYPRFRGFHQVSQQRTNLRNPFQQP